mgnify:CR=1 FL=1
MVTKYPESGIFFTSDTHFGHSKIIDYCKRPFSSIEEHDKVLIQNWNNTVGQDDTIFHLGDFAYGNSQFIANIIKQLNGNIILIKGNHDLRNINPALYNIFSDVVYQARILIDKQTVYLNHFPFLCFEHGDINLYKNNYSIQLFGHVHSGPLTSSKDVSRLNILFPTQYDVGVDNNNYTPISWADVKNKIKQQINKSLCGDL